jgi:1-phosphatidylinositol phosphodiesterase
MVGTHDTGATRGGDAVATQVLSIPAQLNLGVRVLDLRLKHQKNSLDIYHGFVSQNLTGRNAVGQVVAFLKANPTETVLIRMKEEDRGARNTNSFEEAFVEQIFTPYQGTIWTGGGMPTLGQVRGKIVILQGFSGRSFGLNYSGADIQDEYTVKTNWDLYDKWLKVKGQLDRADGSGSGKGRLFMNYLSASGGSFPYFVVSGKSSPATGAPRLSTGFTTPGWKNKYPDFPRVNCLVGICTIAFEGTNALSVQHIGDLTRQHEAQAKVKKAAAPRTFVGILMTDFPGPLLMDTVTRLNAFAK